MSGIASHANGMTFSNFSLVTMAARMINFMLTVMLRDAGFLIMVRIVMTVMTIMAMICCC